LSKSMPIADPIMAAFHPLGRENGRLDTPGQSNAGIGRGLPCALCMQPDGRRRAYWRVTTIMAPSQP
jgi:hypothetical protein